MQLEKPWPSMLITQENAADAFVSVLKNAGAILPKRDVVDIRITDETRNGFATYEGITYKQKQRILNKAKKTGIIDSQNDVGGWPELKSTPAPLDTDNDGMPDAWEKQQGLNPNNASDRNIVAKDGYTMLEKYLNAIW